MLAGSYALGHARRVAARPAGSRRGSGARRMLLARPRAARGRRASRSGFGESYELLVAARLAAGRRRRGRVGGGPGVAHLGRAARAARPAHRHRARHRDRRRASAGRSSARSPRRSATELVFSAVGVVALVPRRAGRRRRRSAVERRAARRPGRRARASRRVLAGAWLTTLPALFFGTFGVLTPLRLDDLGVGAAGVARGVPRRRRGRGGREPARRPPVGPPRPAAAAARRARRRPRRLPRCCRVPDARVGARRSCVVAAGGDRRDDVGAGDGAAQRRRRARRACRRASRSGSSTSRGRAARSAARRAARRSPTRRATPCRTSCSRVARRDDARRAARAGYDRAACPRRRSIPRVTTSAATARARSCSTATTRTRTAATRTATIAVARGRPHAVPARVPPPAADRPAPARAAGRGRRRGRARPGPLLGHARHPASPARSSSAARTCASTPRALGLDIDRFNGEFASDDAARADHDRRARRAGGRRPRRRRPCSSTARALRGYDIEDADARPSQTDAARLARRVLGGLELALDEVEARVPEARVGEVDADDLPELLGAASSRPRAAGRGTRGRTHSPSSS